MASRIGAELYEVQRLRTFARINEGCLNVHLRACVATVDNLRVQS